MILTLITVLGVTVLLVSFWKRILDFLNGPVRDLLERVFGAKRCGWYVKFLQWCDDKITPVARTVKMYWKKFKDTVINLKSIWRKNPDGTYEKETTTTTRTPDPKMAKKITVVESNIPWQDVPTPVRNEMIARRTKEAELDERALVVEKVRERAEEEGIALAV